MEKKNIFRLIGGIAAIAISGIMFLLIILALGAVATIAQQLAMDFGFVSFILVIMMIFSAITIILGSFLTANKGNKGIVITLIVLMGLLGLLEIIGSSGGGFAIFFGFLALGDVAILILYLVTKEASVINETATITKSEDKIEMLKRFKEDGTITEEEYKKLLMKELEK